MKLLQLLLSLVATASASPGYSTTFETCGPYDSRRTCGTFSEVVHGYGGGSGMPTVYSTECTKYTEGNIFKNRETVEVRRVLIDTCKDVSYVRNYCVMDLGVGSYSPGCSQAVSALQGSKAIQVQDFYRNAFKLVCQNTRNPSIKKCVEPSDLQLYSKCRCTPTPAQRPCDTKTQVITHGGAY